MTTAYSAIEDHGIVGDMHTCALVSKTVFCRILDAKKGGYFSIFPQPSVLNVLSKQRYVPYSNLLETRWMNDEGVITLLDYFPVTSKQSGHSSLGDGHILSGQCPCNQPDGSRLGLSMQHSALIRKLECSRGSMEMRIELQSDLSQHVLQTISFESATETLQLEIVAGSIDPEVGYPTAHLDLLEKDDHQGPGLVALLKLSKGQTVTFVVHSPAREMPDEAKVVSHLARLEEETFDYWTDWTRKCTFRGHYRETVERSLLILKLLTFKPTGAIVAAPTFSLPEHVGGPRNWDYRYSWVRDTASTLYVFLKMGYSEEAEAYVKFIFDRILLMLTSMLTGAVRSREIDIPEVELNHLEGYKGSRPVRIGNTAVSHTQLDIYGELMDSIYLYNKHGNPITYDQWLVIRRMKDMSIWETRGEMQHFVYSKIMLWLALDRGIRHCEKRSSLPCPDRFEWIQVRDELYDEIMDKGYNRDRGHFCQSYEKPEVLDAAIMIAPLVFFVPPNEPRFINTLNKILQSPDQRGLSSSKLVFRYDHTTVDGGVGGREGAFIMVTFWLIEAMARLATSGEHLGNTPQAFSHLACISAAINLGRLGST
ncbi:hypothetical protein BDV12DRAFT_186786 [Aspergillus spectabilis]